MNSALVSIIIPAYNSEKTIFQAVQAALNQTYANIEVVVVDDGSKDGTKNIVQSFARVRYYYQDNAGPASARNHGAGKANGEFLFFTDSDCVADEKWIEKAVKHFNNPDIGVVAGSYGINNPQYLLSLCIHQEIIFRHTFLMPDYPKSFGSYNFAIRKNIFEKIGGFSTEYRYASAEDNDLSYKVLKAGFRIYFDKEVVVKHFHTSSLKKYLYEQYRHGFWRVQLYKKHPEMMRGDDYTFWKDMVEVLLSWSLILAVPTVLFLFEIGCKYVLTVILLFVFLELSFSFRILKHPKESFYYAYVMLLRSIARTLGFSWGFIHFLIKK